MNTEIDTDLAERVGTTLRERGETLSIAESCTGGLLGGTITAVAGSSDYFEAGLTTYSNDAKRRLLGVSRESLDAHGAVSEAVAREMAAGVRDVTDATWGVSTTGIAGPGGGTADKPVGTVFVGVAYAGEWGTGTSAVTVSRLELTGDREAVRWNTVVCALEELLDRFEDHH